MKFNLRSVLSAALLAGLAITALPFSAKAQVVADRYVGIGVADDGFVINGKVPIGDQLSVRPAAITNVNFSDDSDFTLLVPVTYNFDNLLTIDRLQPFAGVGLGGTTKGDGAIGAIATAGADYQLTDRLVANGAANFLLFDDSDTNFSAGFGYSF